MSFGAGRADRKGMNLSSINNYSNNNLESVLSKALQGTGVSLNSPSTSTSGSTGVATDSSQLSPFAQLLSTLQQLQQSNPTEYQKVTQQIANNLQTAAQTAQSNGNTSQATQLTQLAKDFTAASTSGQLPNIQDLAQAIGGGGHHHHSHGGSSSSSSSSTGDSDSSNSTSASGGSSASSTTSQAALEQLLATFQNGSGSQTSSLNPMSIIMNTLSSAGITSTNS